MSKHNEILDLDNKTLLEVLAGLIVGILAGASVMLLLAPQSGKATRAYIQEKGIELRELGAGTLSDTMAQVRSSAHEINVGGRKALNSLKKQGKELAVDQLDQISDAVNTSKTAVKSA